MVVAGIPIAPAFASSYGLVDRLAVPGTTTEAFSWLSTAIVTGHLARHRGRRRRDRARGPTWSLALAAPCALVAALVVLGRRCLARRGLAVRRPPSVSGSTRPSRRRRDPGPDPTSTTQPGPPASEIDLLQRERAREVDPAEPREVDLELAARRGSGRAGRSGGRRASARCRTRARPTAAGAGRRPRAMTSTSRRSSRQRWMAIERIAARIRPLDVRRESSVSPNAVRVMVTWGREARKISRTRRG